MMNKVFSANKKALILSLITTMCCCNLQAQSDGDFLRFSMSNISGNARFNAMGGAFSALGGNFTALSTNPAAIGFFNYHDVSISASVYSENTLSKYYDNVRSNSGLNCNFNSLGYVFPIFNGSKQADNVWRKVQFGLGFNRTNDYNANYWIEGLNTQSSLLDAVAAYNNGYKPENMDKLGYLAYQGFLINPTDTVNSIYQGLLHGGNVTQKKILGSSGHTSEIVFSAGGNFSDKLYVGATVGVPVLRYREISETTETNSEKRAIPYDFSSYTYHETFHTNGAGVNLKLGLIYRPLRFLRIGAAFHTPTYLSLHETHLGRLTADMQHPTQGRNFEESEETYMNYNMIIPAKGILSVGFVIGNFGLVGIEGEMTNYSNMKIAGVDPEYQYSFNDHIKNNYAFAGALRVGTEWRVSFFSIRLGYNFESSPYVSKELSRNWSKHKISGGIGLKMKNWDLDFSCVYHMGKENSYLYNLIDGATLQPLVEPATLLSHRFIYTLTLGVKID